MQISLAKKLATLFLLLFILLAWSFNAEIIKKMAFSDSNLAQTISSDVSLILFGDNEPLPSTEYGIVSKNPEAIQKGTYGFIGTPDEWHEPTIILENQNAWRKDISSYDEIRFFAKADGTGKEIRFSITSWPYHSGFVNINDYIDRSDGQGLNATYKLVKIPISAFSDKNALKQIERLHFGTSKPGDKYNIYIDSISAVKLINTTNTITAQPRIGPAYVPVTEPPKTISIINTAPLPKPPAGITDLLGWRKNPPPVTSVTINNPVPPVPEVPVIPPPPIPANLQGEIIWDGDDEIGSLRSAELTNDSIKGKALLGLGDIWNVPTIHLTRQSLSPDQSEIIFYAKSDKEGSDIVFSMQNCCGLKTNNIDLARYIEGGKITTSYKLVRIPVSALKNESYSLDGFEWMYFIQTPGTKIFIDEIRALDLSENTVENVMYLSNDTINIESSGRYDMNDVLNTGNYVLTNSNDPDFASGINPKSIGRRYSVEKFAGPGMNPDPSTAVIRYDLFLVFDKQMKDGKSYTLTTKNIKDSKGNNFTKPAANTFIFDSKNTVTGTVKVNQVGYLPKSPKYAYIGNYLGDLGAMNLSPAVCEIRRTDTREIVSTYKANWRASDPLWSGENVYDCDFSAFSTPGRYYVSVPGYGRSFDFSIGETVYNDVFKKVARAFYYQRSGTDLPSVYAGKWARSAGHTTTDQYAKIMDNQSHSPMYAGESGTVDLRKGWYDAADYGKYTASASVALNEILTAYDQFPHKFYDGQQNIPESGNGIPDILDEAKWELDWLRNMQSEKDGAVYHYVATENWASTMPNLDTAERRITEKTTHATAQYAAIMAKAYSIFKNFPSHKDYAEDLLRRSEKAWAYLMKNPLTYSFSSYGFTINPPGIGGGENSDDDSASDEKAWAAAELYKATGKDEYNKAFLHFTYNVPAYSSSNAPNGPTGGWQIYGNHASFRASFTYATIKDLPIDQDFLKDFKSRLALYSSDKKKYLRENPYRHAEQPERQNIRYGTYSQSSKNSWTLIKEYLILKDESLLEAAKLNFDAQLGANPLNLSYITGVGTMYPREPLHTPSILDGIEEPIPGIPIYGAGTASNGHIQGKTAQSSDNLYPKGRESSDPYPTLRRYFEIKSIPETAEFTIVDIAYTAAAYAFFTN